MSQKTDKQILDALRWKPMSALELFRSLQLGSVVLDRTLKNLEKLGVIEKHKNVYRLPET